MFLLPIFLGCQNKWKCFIVINGALVTQWVLVEIQPTKEENILRQPHRVLFWLYADMMNFGKKKKKKVMKFSQLPRHACVHTDTHVERDDGWFYCWMEIFLQRKAPLLDTCCTAGHYFLLDCLLQGLVLQDRRAKASLWSPRPPSAVWNCRARDEGMPRSWVRAG